MNNNITLSIEDNNKAAKAYLSVDDKELTIQVVVGEGLQYDFVLSEDDFEVDRFSQEEEIIIL